ncbi:zinc-binding dehydrogenase [Brachybacterium sp. EF45031]|uniref:quinone oxidoreductase family protein n=1 Tax=Brachybacterium sillae TaxID=2810536 RepID=UPI00217CEDE6|nr:zinc-binding dehydrogenase [Brachybacterium sillae]MCS6712497.1 zinc-binding dehydrogenase [Brachybacterium sillae]
MPAERLYHLPRDADPVAAAAVLHTGATAAVGLTQRAPVRAGDTVLVGSAAGGVGSAAVQLAVQAGARVVATARDDDTDAVRALGAEEVVDSRAADLPARLQAALPDGADIVWDTSGHLGLERALACARPEGTVLLTAGLGGSAQLPLADFYPRNLTLRGFAMSALGVEELALAAPVVERLIAAGARTVRGRRVIGLEQVADAYRRLLEGRARDRFVVVP